MCFQHSQAGSKELHLWDCARGLFSFSRFPGSLTLLSPACMMTSEESTNGNDSPEGGESAKARAETDPTFSP